MIVGKIVLTGGPCAGKTTVLAKIEQELMEMGYYVLIVGETASELIKGGIKPFGENAIPNIEFQRLLFSLQLKKESIFEKVASTMYPNKKTVILYDRGIMDNKAYMPYDEYKTLLNELGMQEIDLIDNYDMIIHLVTAADGALPYYTLENNGARSESPEEAVALDQRTMNAWRGHNNLKIIDNSMTFDKKIQTTINTINNYLGEPVSKKILRRFLVNNDEAQLNYIEENSFTKINIEQAYLQSENYEQRLRKKTLENASTYYLTVKQNRVGLEQTILTDKKISERDYYDLLTIRDVQSSLKKERYTFIHEKQYFKLDIYENGMQILETDCNKVKLPSFINVSKEITEDDAYNMINLSKQKGLVLEKKI